MEWHPIFAELLRPLVQDHYEVQTNLPVGDLPREADIVLLRRLVPRGVATFTGLWRYLTTWNVLEFKGFSVDPRVHDLDLLVELGLGIDRRLNAERIREGQPLLPPGEVSFWYLVNHLGRRFLAAARRRLGVLEQLGEGLWRCEIMERLVFLVSADALPVERDSVPLHILSQEAPERELALAQLVVQQAGFWDLYSGWLAFLHPTLWEEIPRMARANGIETTFDLRPMIERVGLQTVIDQIGVQKLLDLILPKLSPKERQELQDRLQQGSASQSPPDTAAP